MDLVANQHDFFIKPGGKNMIVKTFDPRIKI
jgi:hypothetical protein